jgi:hypothetical protein
MTKSVKKMDKKGKTSSNKFCRTSFDSQQQVAQYSTQIKHIFATSYDVLSNNLITCVYVVPPDKDGYECSRTNVVLVV